MSQFKLEISDKVLRNLPTNRAALISQRIEEINNSYAIPGHTMKVSMADAMRLYYQYDAVTDSLSATQYQSQKVPDGPNGNKWHQVINHQIEKITSFQKLINDGGYYKHTPNGKKVPQSKDDLSFNGILDFLLDLGQKTSDLLIHNIQSSPGIEDDLEARYG